jgi:uncharacterized OB-fold protein
MNNAHSDLLIEYYACKDCGQAIGTEAVICTKCGSLAVEKTQSKGKGFLIESVVTYYPPKSHERLAPYTSVFVTMEEGFKRFGVIEGEVKDLPQGATLTAIRVDEAGCIVFAKP